MTKQAKARRRLCLAQAVLNAPPSYRQGDEREGALEAIAQSIGRIELEHKALLTTNEVAQLLGASVDTVYRISRDELPAYRGAGKERMYFKDDVLNYVRQRRVSTAIKKVDPHGTTPTTAGMANVVPFDIDAEIKSLNQGDI